MKVFFDINARRDYYLKADDTKEIAWELGSLDSQLTLYLSEKFGEHKDEAGKNTEFLLNVVRYAVKNVRGLKDSEGNDIGMPKEVYNLPYIGKYTGVADTFLRSIHPLFLSELAGEIMKDNYLTETERKNS